MAAARSRRGHSGCRRPRSSPWFRATLRPAVAASAVPVRRGGSGRRLVPALRAVHAAVAGGAGPSARRPARLPPRTTDRRPGGPLCTAADLDRNAPFDSNRGFLGPAKPLPEYRADDGVGHWMGRFGLPLGICRGPVESNQSMANAFFRLRTSHLPTSHPRTRAPEVPELFRGSRRVARVFSPAGFLLDRTGVS